MRLSAWYQVEIRETQAMLTEQEALVNELSRRPDLVVRTKIPNPYWTARAWAGIYREKLQKAKKLAAWHRKMAEYLQSGATGPPPRK
jgi:hypothetical protein